MTISKKIASDLSTACIIFIDLNTGAVVAVGAFHMTSDSNLHLPQERLGEFAKGDLGDKEITDVQAHLEKCPACLDIVRNLPPDSLSTILGSAGPPLDSSAITAELAVLGDHPKYKILEVIGIGGMGVVYKAKQLELGRNVAIKTIGLNKSFPDAEARFLKEIMGVSKLSHPNIVAIFDAEVFKGVPFFVMEYVEGQTLRDLVVERRKLPVLDACNYVYQAALGLQHANEKQLVHRDIKPQNLMVTRDDKVKILDFGLAKFTSQNADAEIQTVYGEILGTPDFMAPEQFKDARSADTRADIYSLGLTLYYLLSGRLPYEEFKGIDKYYAHRDSNTQPKPLSELKIQLPNKLTAVIDRMIAKDSLARYQTPGEVAAALRPFVPGPPPEPTTSWIPLALSCVTLCLVFGIGVVSYLTWNNTSGTKKNITAADLGKEPHLTRSEDLTLRAWNQYKDGEKILDETPMLDQRLKAIPYLQEAIRLAQLNINDNLIKAEEMQKALESSKTVIPVEGKVPDVISEVDRQRIHLNWAVNDISACLFIIGRSNEYIANLNRESRLQQNPKPESAQHKEYSSDELVKVSNAKDAYAKAMLLSHGRVWDPDQNLFWNPPKDSSGRHKLLTELSSK